MSSQGYSMQSVSDGFSTDVSERTRERERAQLGRACEEWETDYSTDVSDNRRRKGRRVIKSPPVAS